MDQTAQTTPTMGATDAPEQHMPSTDPHRGRNRAYVAVCLVAALIAAVVGAVLLTGGNDKPTAGPTTPPAPSATSPAPSPTVTSAPTPEDVAAAAAKAKYLEYLRVDDAVAQGGYTNLTPYDGVAVSPERSDLAVAAARLAGIRTTGSTVVASLGVQSVKLTTNPAESFSEVRLVGCLDVTGVKAFRADGTSAVTADRLPRTTVNVVVQMVPATALEGTGRPEGWYVSKVEYPGGGTAC